MDIFSVLRTTVEIIRVVDQYAISSKDTESSFESLTVQLDSTRKLLASLEKLVTESGDESNTSNETTANPSQDNSVMRLIEDEGQPEQLQKHSRGDFDMT